MKCDPHVKHLFLWIFIVLQHKSYKMYRGGPRISRWGGANPRWRGCQPPTQALFGENICKNERIWSCWGGGVCQKLLYVDLPVMYLNIGDKILTRKP